MKKYSLFGVAIVFASLQACSSSSNSETTATNDAQGSNTVGEQGNTGTGTTGSLGLISSNAVSVPDTLTAASRSIIFDYGMTGVSGNIVTARAQLFEPNTTAPEDGHALVVWAHGTTGIANACQPSQSFENFGNVTAINALLSAGYAVLAPDYEGFGTDRIHPYYIRSSHANAITESIPAVHQIAGVSLSDDWAVVGHSQGGHVAMSAARATALDAYPLQAVVALAPGTDLKPFSNRAFEAIDEKVAQGETQDAFERLFYLNVYAAYVAHAVAEVNPDFDPKSIFGEAIAPIIDTAIDESFCGRYATAVDIALGNHFDNGGTPIDFQGLTREWYDVPGIASRLESEAFADEEQVSPLLILQGDADRQVPVAATSAFVDSQRALGTDVTYEIIAGARHGDVARAEFGRVVTWLAETFPAR